MIVGKDNKIDDIFYNLVKIRQDIDTFLKKEVLELLGYDAQREIVANDEYNINYYDGYNKQHKVHYTKEEFITFIRNQIIENDSQDICAGIDITKYFKDFISIKIANQILS